MTMNYKDLLEPRKEGYTDYEVAASIRNYRNRELAASDYTQLPDVDLPNKWDWAVYRQALRDMMQQNDDPKLIVFPEPPK